MMSSLAIWTKSYWNTCNERLGTNIKTSNIAIYGKIKPKGYQHAYGYEMDRGMYVMPKYYEW